jgi:hypothetical protein
MCARRCKQTNTRGHQQAKIVNEGEVLFNMDFAASGVSRSGASRLLEKSEYSSKQNKSNEEFVILAYMHIDCGPAKDSTGELLALFG